MWQTSEDNLWGSTRYSDNYCGSYRVNSVTHKKLLKTQNFEKKGKLSSEKKFWTVFSPILECDKPEGRICEYLQSILTIAFEVRGLILLHLWSCWKHKILKKKGKLSSEKKFWTVFSPILECDKPEGRICEYLQSILTIAFEVRGLILLHLRSCWKHKILKKKANFPVKRVLDCFFSYSRVWQTWGANLWISTIYFDNCFWS